MYFFEMLSIFALLMFFGLFFGPFFGGCLGLMIMLIMLGGFLLFFSLNFIWFILVGCLIYIASGAVKYYRWYKLPDLNSYLLKHPECRLDAGVSCYSCKSNHTAHQGLYGRRSKWRFYSCTQCGTTLFRFHVL